MTVLLWMTRAIWPSRMLLKTGQTGRLMGKSLKLTPIREIWVSKYEKFRPWRRGSSEG